MLNPTQQAEVVAYAAMLSDKLRLAMVCVCVYAFDLK